MVKPLFRLSLAKFLSTPSARRATVKAAGWSIDKMISIHALREEGDPLGMSLNSAL